MPLAAALLLPALLAGCASGPTAEITRFNLGAPIPRETVVIEAAPGLDARGLEFASIAAGVQSELAAIGFAAADSPAGAGYIAVVSLEQVVRDGPPRGPALSIGIGGGSFGRGGGVGGGIAVPVGAPRTSELRQTRLSIRLRRRSDASVVWEGRAVEDLPADAAASSIASAVPRLARALLADFPGRNGETIRVKTGGPR
ncbi:hypothetical protein IP88_13825 [alpha proteobacterium AAP81b]|nr:hypothetical protein IP88_13825 [alpha proteobacterium AAP81b]